MRNLLLIVTLLSLGLAACAKSSSSCGGSSSEASCGALSEREVAAAIAKAERGDARAANTLVVHYGALQNYGERSKWLWSLISHGDCHAAQIYYEDGHISGGGNTEASKRAAELRQKTACPIREIVVDETSEEPT